MRLWIHKRRLPEIRLLLILQAVLWGLTFSPALMAQQTQIQPDCVVNFTFTAASQFSVFTGCAHNVSGILDWTMTYNSQGFSGVSIIVQSAADVDGSPGSWGTFNGTTITGSNPLTSTTGGFVQLQGYNPWNRVFLTTGTGSGTISGTLYGCRQPGCAGTPGADTGGTVTSITADCGISGGTITTTGTIGLAQLVRGVTGGTDTILSGDCGQVVTYSNATSTAVVLPSAGGSFPNGFPVDVSVLPGAGTVTITPATGTVGGEPALSLSASQGCHLTSDGTNWQTQCGAAVNAVPPPPPPSPGYPANQTLSGCGVEYVSGLSFTIGACMYTIAGQVYNSPITMETLAAADPSNPRIDLIGVNNAGVVFVITGTPAASPAEPSVDPSTQLALIFVTVNATATTPANVSETTIYYNNTGWTSTCSTNLNCASTNNPYAGTFTIEATNAVLGNNVTFVDPAAGTENLQAFNTLTFYIRSKATWPIGKGSGANGARTLSLFWLNGATQVGTAVVLNNGAFGFNTSQTTAYQQISIPLTLFGTGSNLVTTLEVEVSGNGGSSSIGLYMDEITLQAGNGLVVLPTTLMNFKGTWTSTASYNANDTVVSGGIGYVALVANTNVAVSTGGTWAALGQPATANAVTAAIAAAAAKQVCVSSGASRTCTYIDFPDVKVIPAANCTAGTAGAGWSSATSNFAAQCRAGSNNLGGMLQAVPSAGASAQFLLELPADWDTGSQPYINIFYGSGSNTSGTVIWTVSSACSKEDGSVTDDPSFNAESAFSSQTMGTANRMWAQNGQFTHITSGNNCIPGSSVIIKVAVSGSAGSNINAYQAVVTIPRLLTVQAN